jgi:hypothetical protein
MPTLIQITSGYQERYELLSGKIVQQNILHANLPTSPQPEKFSNQVWDMTVKQWLAFVCGLWKQRRSD